MSNEVVGFDCGYGLAWTSPCRVQVVAEGLRCDEHAGRLCKACGRPASGDCSHAGQFVCGQPTCHGGYCVAHGGKRCDVILHDELSARVAELEAEIVRLHEVFDPLLQEAICTELWEKK